MTLYRKKSLLSIKISAISEKSLDKSAIAYYNVINESAFADGQEVKEMYENLKALLAAKGISYEVLARLLGVHRDTVTNKLNGESEFTYGQAEVIQETLFPEYNIRYVFRRSPAA